MWYQPYVAAQFNLVRSVRGHYIVITKPDVALYLHPFRSINNTIDGAQEGRFTATRGTYDTCYAVLRNLHRYVLQYVGITYVYVQVFYLDAIMLYGSKFMNRVKCCHIFQKGLRFFTITNGSVDS